MNNVSPGELKERMLVTILNWKPQEEAMTANIGGESRTITYSKKDHKGEGEVLEILAVDLPYIVVCVHNVRGISATLDTRLVDLMEISLGFVEASLGRPFISKLSPLTIPLKRTEQSNIELPRGKSI